MALWGNNINNNNERNLWLILETCCMLEPCHHYWDKAQVTNWLIGMSLNPYVRESLMLHCLPRRPLLTGNYVKQQTPTRFELEKSKKNLQREENVLKQMPRLAGCIRFPTLHQLSLHVFKTRRASFFTHDNRARSSTFPCFYFLNKSRHEKELTFSAKVGTGAARRCACALPSN